MVSMERKGEAQWCLCEVELGWRPHDVCVTYPEEKDNVVALLSVWVTLRGVGVLTLAPMTFILYYDKLLTSPFPSVCACEEERNKLSCVHT